MAGRACKSSPLTQLVKQINFCSSIIELKIPKNDFLSRIYIKFSTIWLTSKIPSLSKETKMSQNSLNSFGEPLKTEHVSFSIKLLT